MQEYLNGVFDPFYGLTRMELINMSRRDLIHNFDPCDWDTFTPVLIGVATEISKDMPPQWQEMLKGIKNHYTCMPINKIVHLQAFCRAIIDGDPVPPSYTGGAS